MTVINNANMNSPFAGEKEKLVSKMSGRSHSSLKLVSWLVHHFTHMILGLVWILESEVKINTVSKVL